MKRSAWILALLAGVTWPVACGFPTVQSFASGGGGSGTGNGSSTSSDHGGGSSSSNPTSAGGGGMSSTMSNGGNPSGGGVGGTNSGGGGSSSTSSTTSGSGGGPVCAHHDDGDDCDCDGDGHRKTTCAAKNGKPNDDCADYDARAFHGQTKFYSTPIKGPVDDGTNTYDFNCDGSNTKEWPDLVCGGLNVCNVAEGWLDKVPDCGDSGSLESGCTGLHNCTNGVMMGDTPQPCH